eukprot:m.429597 g.429597  ORF g.429597 m.429597 type:complete len:134 (+) comp17032_c0_seq1:105-506(+)
MLRFAVARASVAARAAARPAAAPMVSVRYMGSELSPQDFDAKWVAYFEDESLTSREIRRGLNDVFAHDLVPDPSILTAAFRATRRVNDFPTSVRIFEGIKDKSPDDATYSYVLSQLQPVIDELQLSTPEELGF